MLTRRSSLLLPVLLAACGGRERREYPPLHFNYLLPLQLNVVAIRIEQRFVPAGVPPDVSQQDPMPPVLALRNMAEDRLQALGSGGEAVFVIQDASLIRRRDTIQGNFTVQLEIYTAPNVRAAYARASVSRTFTGDVDDLPAQLYDMTKAMMDGERGMNVEFEYQVRHSLGAWLVTGNAIRAPVEQQPLTASPPSVPLPMPLMQPR